MGLNLWIYDALNDWAREIKQYPQRANDADRAEVLKVLKESHRVAFEQWDIDDLVIFVVRAYPEDLLTDLAHHRKPSRFLRALYDFWRPPPKKSISEWVCFLRRICVLGSFRLFVQTLRLNHFQRGDSWNDLGHVLFLELPRYRTILPPEYPPDAFRKQPFGEKIIESVIASFVRRPHDVACSRDHATAILRLTRTLGPIVVGTTCRRLLMFLARDPTCHCDYADPQRPFADSPRKAECDCPLNLEMDPGKEYARALFHEIFRITRWDADDKAYFLAEACKNRFSLVVYNELAICLQAYPDGRNEPLRNPDVRPYTQQELKNAYDRTDSAVLSAGCAVVNCKQSFNTDCANVMCGTHCRKHGTNPCRISKHNGNYGVDWEFSCLCCNDR